MNLKYPLPALAALCGWFTAVRPAFAQDWVLTSAPNLPWTSIASSADGTKLVAVASDTVLGVRYPDGIWTSTNSGGTWTNRHYYGYGGMWKAVASSADGTTLVAAGYDEYFCGQIFCSFAESWIYTSTNSDASWAGIDQHSSGTPYSSWGEWNAVASSADGTKLVATSTSTTVLFGGAPMSISRDSGATWTQTGPPGYGLTAVASSADGSKLVAVGYYVYTSTNSGASWTQTSAPSEVWTSVASSSDGTKLVAVAGNFGSSTNNNPIYTSSDSGATWTQTSAPLLNWRSVASSADGTKLVASASTRGTAARGGIYTSTDSGATWTSNNVPRDLPLGVSTVVASSADGTRLVAVTHTPQGLIGGGIYIAQSTPALSITITPSGTNALLSWTIPSMDFTLQQNSDLTTTNWTDVPTPPVLNLTTLQNQVAVSATNSAGFFRLKH